MTRTLTSDAGPGALSGFPPDLGDAHSIGEFVLRRLRGDIVSTRLKPGAKLPFHYLAKRYGVGVSPLRDALSQLAGDGLVILRSQKGFWVAPVSREDLKDISFMRRRLELMALDMAIDRGDTAWDSRMRAAYADFCRVKQRVGDQEPITEEWEGRHRAFHFALLSACGSPTLMHFCEQMHDRFHRYRRIALPTKSFMSALGDDHGDMMDAAISRDKPRAAKILDEHLASSARLIEANIEFEASSDTLGCVPAAMQ
jgi:GntR family transcriptional regulator, carbon starvation induced regulator